MSQIDTEKMQNDCDAPSRFDIYRYIHKAVRAFMCDTLIQVGNADGADAEEMTRVIARVRGLVAFCVSHLEHENDFVHAAMEARCPGSSDATAGDHVHHADACEKLAALADAVEQAASGGRNEKMTQLYLYLALFVAENFTHMNVEETENNTALWATHSDEELIGIEHAIVASLTPEENAITLRWMIPALNASERAEFLRGVLRTVPAPVFDGMLASVKPHLTTGDWEKLMGALRPGELLAA
jgi:hypothetical protein